jgi:hypothetical protein
VLTSCSALAILCAFLLLQLLVLLTLTVGHGSLAPLALIISAASLLRSRAERLCYSGTCAVVTVSLMLNLLVYLHMVIARSALTIATLLSPNSIILMLKTLALVHSAL